jgi:hypothetical protein
LKLLRLILLLVVGGWLLTACSRETFRKIENGEQLRRDCVELLDKYAGGEIPKGAWPKSVQVLKPMHVTREAENIRILMYQKQGKFAGGYCVFRDVSQAPSTKGVWVQKTAFKGVYRFETAY